MRGLRVPRALHLVVGPTAHTKRNSTKVSNFWENCAVPVAREGLHRLRLVARVLWCKQPASWSFRARGARLLIENRTTQVHGQHLAPSTRPQGNRTLMAYLQALPVARGRQPPLVKVTHNIHPVHECPRRLPPQLKPFKRFFRCRSQVSTTS